MGLSTTAFVMTFAAACAACIDPVHNDAVQSLGGEVAGVRPGPEHRPGQPCLTCHGPYGPANPEMSLAGTIYAVRGGTEALSGVTVSVTDALGATRAVVSNGAGNFYIFKSEWSPSFPLTVTITDGTTEQKMKSTIGRDGACATCHRGSGDALRMPAIFMRTQ